MFIFVLLIMIACLGASWLITCGLIKLITICFGLAFSWSIATGIWLILLILKSIFSDSSKK